MESAVFHLNGNELDKTIQAQEATYDYVVPAQTFETLADRFLEDDSFDIAQAIRQYKTPTFTKCDSIQTKI